MSAHNSTFPWLSYYGHYKFFEARMHEHSKVQSIEEIDTGLYDVHLMDGRVLRVFICECYAFDETSYYEVLQNHGSVNAMVISGNWCGYDFDMKIEKMDDEVGIFDIKGFMAAINKKNFWEYMTEYEKERLKQR